MLAEPHDEWAVARRYMAADGLAELGCGSDGNGEEVIEQTLSNVM